MAFEAVDLEEGFIEGGLEFVELGLYFGMLLVDLVD